MHASLHVASVKGSTEQHGDYMWRCMHHYIHISTCCASLKALLPARRYASADTSYGPVSVCLCLSQVGVLSKRMNKSGWFLAGELPSTYSTLCCKEI